MSKQRIFVVCVLMAAMGAAWAQDGGPAKQQIVANEGKIGDRWALADGVQLAVAQYPAALAPRGDDACIALGYQINEDGTTSDFAVLKQWNSANGEDEPEAGYWQQFAQSGADALSQWRFKPRPEAGAVRPTYTVATLSFKGGKGQGGDVASHCRIDDLVALVQKHKSHAYMNSRERHELDNANRAARMGRPMNNPLSRGSTR